MSQAAAATARDPLGAWCGGVLVGAAALAPLLAWFAPMGFWYPAVMGLLCLPALRMRDEDRPVLIVLFATLIWAAVSTTWSPYHPKNAASSTILKLALELPLYWSAVCGARRASPRRQTLALRILAFGLTISALGLLTEALTDAAGYQWLHEHLDGPIRHDIAESHLGHSTFALAVLWPVAGMGAPRRLRIWLLAVMAIGIGVAAVKFGSDAPVIGLVAAPVVALVFWRWPRVGPWWLAGKAAALFLGAPAIVWAVRMTGRYEEIRQAIPLSWAIRMGYWSHALDWIGDKPLRGWGLDASRMFSPGIELHPHDGALQVWLELGAVGAIMAAVFWGLSLARLARRKPSAVAAASGASAAIYLLFGALNFGIWQEWWLGLGALVVLVVALLEAQPAEAASDS